MISATVYCDFSQEDRDADRRVVTSLYAVQPGSRVILFVGDRRHVTPEIHHVREYVSTLHLDVHGSPGAVVEWTNALYEQGQWGSP